MKFKSFDELKDLRDAMMKKIEPKQNVKKPCPRCNGGRVVFNQGADVCCPSCNGRG
jgi:DnaJ-class molecular chaperone